VVELALDRIGERASTDLDSGGELIAPPLLWSEVPSVLHEISFRGEISDALAELALQRFLSGRLSIDERRPEGHYAAAWAVAEEFGWAKTYDAEYVAREECGMPPRHPRHQVATRNGSAGLRHHSGGALLNRSVPRAWRLTRPEPPSGFGWPSRPLCGVKPQRGPVAQLERAPLSKGGSPGFESRRAAGRYSAAGGCVGVSARLGRLS
jgi:predicted nucleic acid-binding protein